MSRVKLNVEIELLSDTIFSAGYSIPGGEDISLKTGPDGKPFLAGSTLKGVLRESVENVLFWNGKDGGIKDCLFGVSGWEQGNENRRLIFSSFTLKNGEEMQEESDWSSPRAFTAIENGTAAEKSLRLAMCLNKGLVFEGFLLADEEDADLVSTALGCIKSMGLLRNRGFGAVQVTAGKEEAGDVKTPLKGTGVIHYVLKAVTPVTIPNHTYAGKENNHMDGRDYIPGSAVRGMVLTDVLADGRNRELREKLLREVRFTNALPLSEDGTQIPTPMGFYSDKSHRNPYSVLDSDARPGHKRHPAKHYCRIREGVIYTSAPDMQISMRIKRGAGEDQKIFTASCIAAGTRFEGYIFTDDPELTEVLSTAFCRPYIWIGADRYAGNGLCEVSVLDGEMPDYSFGYAVGDAVPETVYMMAASPFTMNRNGESIGLDAEALAELLGVQNVSLEKCATSVTEMVAYNNCWGGNEPAATMYESGSMFKLRCTPAPKAEALLRLQKRGLGMGLQQGYGHVLFLKDFSSYTFAEEEKRGADGTETPEMALRREKMKWILENRKASALSAVSKSQLGTVQARLEKIAAGKAEFRELEDFFAHNAEKRNEKSSPYEKLYEYLKELVGEPVSPAGQKALGDTLAALDRQERIRLVIELIDMKRKGGTGR